jgi:hypothetical protein
MNDGADLDTHLARQERLKAKHNNGNGAGMPLGMACKQAGWPSPTALSYNESHQPGNNRSMNETVRLCGWETPTVRDARNSAASNSALPRMAGWATPAQRDHRYPNSRSYQERSQSRKGEQLNNQVVHGLITTPCGALTAKNGVLNPAFPRWLMGFPKAWDEYSPGYSEWLKTRL